MIFLDQSYTITRWDPEKDLEEICRGARICYKGKEIEGREEMENYIRNLRDRDPEHPHHSPLEHSILSVEFVTNRGITHELVRHRLASFNQESSRYCNYSQDRFDKHVRFIYNRRAVDKIGIERFKKHCKHCEDDYFESLITGCTPDEARGCLNNDVKSEIKITANYREWRHIFKLRCDDKHAHYQMVELMRPLFDEVCAEVGCIFDDIKVE